MPFDTPLSPEEQEHYQNWKSWFAPHDSGADYDFQGAFKAGIRPDPETGHWPDTFKKPNHPTFSDQSIYSSLAGTKPGAWKGEQYSPFGYAEQPHPFWKALEGVVRGIRGMQTSKANPSLFHEPTVAAGAGVEAGLSKASEVLSDPRNAWLGFGPIAMATRPAGWGAEVLRRYKLLGGTPETLNRTLSNKALFPRDREYIVSDFRAGTDLAAPPLDTFGGGNLQAGVMNRAGKNYDRAMFYHNLPDDLGRYEELADKDFFEKQPHIPSGSKGNAAYDAVSRQVGRMLDKPGFGFSKAQDLPRVNELEYMDAFPIEPQRVIDALYERQRMPGLAGPNARPNVRRPDYGRGSELYNRERERLARESERQSGIERRVSPTGLETTIVRERRRGYPNYEEFPDISIPQEQLDALRRRAEGR